MWWVWLVRSRAWLICLELGRRCSRSTRTVRCRAQSPQTQSDAPAVWSAFTVDKMRLDCFDAVVVATWCVRMVRKHWLRRTNQGLHRASTRFSEFDVKVINMLKKKGVPYFLVRDLLGPVPPDPQLKPSPLAC